MAADGSFGVDLALIRVLTLKRNGGALSSFPIVRAGIFNEANRMAS
jgi:hypothetical protein